MHGPKRIQFATPGRKRLLGFEYERWKREFIAPEALAGRMKQHLALCSKPLLFVHPNPEPFEEGVREGSVVYSFNRFGDRNSNELLDEILSAKLVRPGADACYLGPDVAYGTAPRGLPGGKFENVEAALREVVVLPKTEIVDRIAPVLAKVLMANDGENSDNAVAMGRDASGYYAFYWL